MRKTRRNTTLVGPSDVARHLRISIKALRLYEQQGLVKPARTARGWRRYSPMDLERLSRVLAFKAMGFGLAEIAKLLDAPASDLSRALAAQEKTLEQRRKAVDDALTALQNARQQASTPKLRLAA